MPGGEAVRTFGIYLLDRQGRERFHFAIGVDPAADVRRLQPWLDALAGA